MERNCGSCAHSGPARMYSVFGVAMGASSGLACRRYPPVFIIAGGEDTSVRIGWPVVKASDFCGEFAPKPVTS